MRLVAVYMVMLGFGGFGRESAATATGTRFQQLQQQQPLRVRIPTCARDCANRFLLLSEFSDGVGSSCANNTATLRGYEECLHAQSQECLATDTPPSAAAVIDLLCPTQLGKREDCVRGCHQPTPCDDCQSGQSCVLTSASCLKCAAMECEADGGTSQFDSSSASGGGGKKITTVGIAAICVVCVLGVLLVIVFFVWGIKRRRARAGMRGRRRRTGANSQPLDQAAVQQFATRQQQQKEAALREAAMKEAALVGAAGALGNDEHAKKPLPGPWQEEAMWRAEAMKEVALPSPQLARVAGANQVDGPNVGRVHSIERKPLPGRKKSAFGEDGRVWVRASEMERECQREEANLLKPPKAVWC